MTSSRSESDAAPDYGTGLCHQHRDKLVASGVSTDVARARGYRSATTKAQLRQVGFGQAQQRPPALVIPLHGVTGEPEGFQCRPDEPRSRDGRVVKYETPTKQPMVLDVPPAVRTELDDPRVALFVAESPIKADAGVSHGLCCVDVLGVWGWRSGNSKGGKTALPAFENIALNDRRVVIAFDSDAHSKPGVHDAMERLGDFLAHRDAKVQYLYLPHGANGAKTGLDDFLVDHPVSDLWDLCSDELYPLPGTDAVEPEDDFTDLEDETGAELLDDVVDFVTRYCAFAFVEQADAIALWVVHTHLPDAFTTTPRLWVSGPTVSCGKTRVLEAIEPLALNPRLAVSVSGPYMFRTIGVRPVTLLLDEYETTWRDDSDHGQDLRAIVDGGYRKGSTVGRVVGMGAELKPVDFPIFCPVALAGVGWVPDSVRTRSIPIHMRRRGPGETVEPYDRDDVFAAAAPLVRRLRAWAHRNRERLDRQPTLPDGVEDRPAELWRPLVSIAQRAGGHWPETARAACLKLTIGQGEDADPATALLADIRSVFDGTDRTNEEGTPVMVPVDEMFSTELVDRLNAREDWPWAGGKRGPLTPQGLAKRLDEFEVQPKIIRIGAGVKRGYQRAQFDDAWQRFTPAPVPQALHPLHPLHGRSGATSDVTPVTGVTATERQEGKGYASVVDLGRIEDL